MRVTARSVVSLSALVVKQRYGVSCGTGFTSSGITLPKRR